jgi:hypothetical protein
MTSGELVGKVVSLDFRPACENCCFYNECAVKPKHAAYPRRWRWSRLGVVFPEGVLILASWLGDYRGSSASVECSYYRVACGHCKEGGEKHREYAEFERRRRMLEAELRYVSSHEPDVMVVVYLRQELEIIEGRQRALIAD